MGRKQVDVFGFDELESAFEGMRSKYAVQSDALLAASAMQAAKRARQLSPRVTGYLRRNWRYLKPISYKGGTVRVSCVRNIAYHAHLVEYGHEIYTTGINKKTGKMEKTGKVSKYNAAGRRTYGIKNHGRTQGKYILRSVMQEFESRYPKSVEEILDKITKELEI